MIGGYEKFGVGDYIEKTVNGLGGHGSLRIRATFFKIDGWNSKKGQLYVDGALVWESPVLSGEPRVAIGSCVVDQQGATGGDCCGVINYQQGDQVMSMDITVSHIAASVTLRFTSSLDQAGDYWGVNHIKVELASPHPSPPAPPSPPGVWTQVDHALWPGAVGWVSNVAIAESNCGELGSMAGGFQVFGHGDYIEKTYSGLPAHSGIRITGTMFKIDGWNNKAGQIFVDGGHAWQSSTYGGQPAVSSCCCGVIGYNNGDLTFNFDTTVDHYAENAAIRFTTNLDSAGDYWGVNDIKVTLILDHPSPPAPPSLPGVWSTLTSDQWPGATGWTSNVGTPDSSMVGTCGSAGTYLGIRHFSMGAHLQRTFSLATHTALRIRASTIQVDYYDYQIQMQVDGGFAWHSEGNGQYLGQVCGNLGYGKNEYTYEIDVTVGHIASSATINFTSTAASADRFWGINGIKIDLITAYPSPPMPPSPPGSWAAVVTDSWPGATGWTSSIAMDASAVTTCSTWTMIGGYGKLSVGDYLEKTFSALPTHTSLRIRATLYKIDYWSNAKFEVLVDGQVAWQSSTYSSHGTKICGVMSYNQNDLAVDMDVTTAHTASSVTIRFSSTVSSADNFWGLQGVTVQAVNAG